MMSGIAVILTALVACFAVVTPVSAAVVQTSISSSRTFTRNNTVQPQSLSETTSVHTEDDVHWGGIEELQVPITKSPAQIKAEQEAARKKAEEEAARKKAAEERAAALLKQQANKQEEQPSSDNNDNVGTFLDGQPWDAPKTSSPGNGYPWGQCTWWVYERRVQLELPVSGYFGNAGTWAHSAKQSGYDVSNVPEKQGDIVVFEPGQAYADAQYGHVGIIEEIQEDGTIVISESNAKGLGVISKRAFNPQEAVHFTYIH